MTDFDPTKQGQDKYKESGMSGSNYYVQKVRWLKQQAKQEGYTGSLTTYTPKGFRQIWTGESAQDPNKYYWKPDAYAQGRPDLPYATWDKTKEIQNYWHDPANVVRWHNFFRVQDEDYEPKQPWLDKDLVESQYKALKD